MSAAAPNFPGGSKERVSKAGDAVRHGHATEEDLDVINTWRAAHRAVLNTFQAILRNRTRGLKIAVAQRHKRRSTIFDKLNRLPGMRLARMDDVAGCRLIFDTVDTLKDTLRIFCELVAGITVKPEAMERAALKGYATATDLADYLVKKGLPFRDAHEVVAHAVKLALSQGADLSDLPLATLQTFNASIADDVYAVLTLRGSLNARSVLGGTAPQQVRAQVARHRARLG